MSRLYRNNGFSLTEVLLSIGVLAIGMIFVAGVFPVGIYFTTVSTERTIAAVVADEAFAKLRLYADPNSDNDDDDIDLINGPQGLQVDELRDFNDVFNIDDFFKFPYMRIDHDVNNFAFAYPSDPTYGVSEKTYFWSALCRLTRPNSRLVQVTVFVCRKAVGEKYWYKDPPYMTTNLYQGSGPRNYPKPVWVNVIKTNTPDVIEIDNSVNPIEKTFINDGYTIVDNATGQLYRVLERYAHSPKAVGRDKLMLLDRPWEGTTPGAVWVVPPPVDGGRNPCIAVYQKLIRF